MKYFLLFFLSGTYFIRIQTLEYWLDFKTFKRKWKKSRFHYVLRCNFRNILQIIDDIQYNSILSVITIQESIFWLDKSMPSHSSIFRKTPLFSLYGTSKRLSKSLIWFLTAIALGCARFGEANWFRLAWCVLQTEKCCRRKVFCLCHKFRHGIYFGTEMTIIFSSLSFISSP